MQGSASPPLLQVVPDLLQHTQEANLIVLQLTAFTSQLPGRSVGYVMTAG